MYKILNIPIPEEHIVTFDEFYDSMQNQKYRKHYKSLIFKARSRIIFAYSEKHHIIPKCLGGVNNEENYVNLTPEEHFVAHLLLCKTFPNNNKIVYAAKMMTTNKLGYRINNRFYGWLRRKFSESMSGENNPMFGKVGELSPHFGKKNHGSSEGCKQRVGEKHPNFGKMSGELNPMFGKKRLDRFEICKRQVGELNPMFGKKNLNLSEWCRDHSGENHPMFGKKNPSVSESNRKRGLEKRQLKDLLNSK